MDWDLYAHQTLAGERRHKEPRKRGNKATKKAGACCDIGIGRQRAAKQLDFTVSERNGKAHRDRLKQLTTISSMRHQSVIRILSFPVL